MDSGELHHLLFRWLHVVSAMVWIGHIWSLVFAQPMHQPPTDMWSRVWSGATWLTGVSLLIVVYYWGGALTTPSQSLWMAIGVGVTVLLVTWLLYDALWTLLSDRPAIAAAVSLLLLAAIAQGLAEFMTGRAVFIHVGGTLGIILVNNTNQRPARIVHNAIIAPAVILFMVSNHFPLIYGTTRPWLVAADPGHPRLRDRVLAALAVSAPQPATRIRRSLNATAPELFLSQRRDAETPRRKGIALLRGYASTSWAVTAAHAARSRC